MDRFLEALGPAIEDADEETFNLFSQSRALEDLGMIDPQTAELDISIGNRDFTIKQSIGTLHSSREGGTTGSAVWKSSARLGEWLASTNNALFTHGILGPQTVVLELGSGVSGIVPCMLDQHVKQIIATDQSYALKLLHENIRANCTIPSKRRNTSKVPAAACTEIQIHALDWETSDIPSSLAAYGQADGVDVVFASDTIYNYALLRPFTQTCVDICRVRKRARDDGSAHLAPTICVVVQLLRQSDVFGLWMELLLEEFRVWRVPKEIAGASLGVEAGFVVHVLMLKEEMPS